MNTSYSNNRSNGHFAGGLIRPAWTPVTIAMMIIGFMIFWPLGMAMIAYILWGDRLDEFKSNINSSTDRFAGKWSRDCGSRRYSAKRTGNVAFDEWRESEIDRLKQERRKIEEMRAEFDDHLQELRRAKDKDDFDVFMEKYKRNTRGQDKGSKKKNKTVPDS